MRASDAAGLGWMGGGVSCPCGAAGCEDGEEACVVFAPLVLRPWEETRARHARQAGYVCACGDSLCFTPHTCLCGTPGCTRGCSAPTEAEHTTRRHPTPSPWDDWRRPVPRYWVLLGHPVHDPDEEGGNAYYQHDDLDEAMSMYADAMCSREEDVFLIDYGEGGWGYYDDEGVVLAEAFPRADPPEPPIP